MNSRIQNRLFCQKWSRAMCTWECSWLLLCHKILYGYKFRHIKATKNENRLPIVAIVFFMYIFFYSKTFNELPSNMIPIQITCHLFVGRILFFPCACRCFFSQLDYTNVFRFTFFCVFSVFFFRFICLFILAFLSLSEA